MMRNVERPETEMIMVILLANASESLKGIRSLLKGRVTLTFIFINANKERVDNSLKTDMHFVVLEIKIKLEVSNDVISSL